MTCWAQTLGLLGHRTRAVPPSITCLLSCRSTLPVYPQTEQTVSTLPRLSLPPHLRSSLLSLLLQGSPFTSVPLPLPVHLLTSRLNRALIPQPVSTCNSQFNPSFVFLPNQNNLFSTRTRPRTGGPAQNPSWPATRAFSTACEKPHK